MSYPPGHKDPNGKEVVMRGKLKSDSGEAAFIMIPLVIVVGCLLMWAAFTQTDLTTGKKMDFTHNATIVSVNGTLAQIETEAGNTGSVENPYPGLKKGDAVVYQEGGLFGEGSIIATGTEEAGE